MMTLSNTFQEARQAFINAVTAGEPQEKQNALYDEMLATMFEESKKVARQEVDGALAMTPLEASMTPRERQFFNELSKGAPEGIEEFLPEETIDRIFENLKKKHPLLEHLGLRNGSFRLKFYEAETSGVAEWGNIFDEIKGQLKQKFNKRQEISHKLTAFVVLPKDAEKFGPSWLMGFVLTQIDEAFATALEKAFLNGDGDSKPVGLSRKLTGRVESDKTVFDVKETSGTLTFADAKTTVAELTTIHKHHSVDSKGNPVEVDGQIVMVVNPSNAWEVKRQHTSLNAQGVFVTAMPFNVTLVESIHQEAGKVTTFVKGRYLATVAGGFEMTHFTETMALEDLNLYTAKQFVYGKARDEKSAAVWTLNVRPVG